MNPLDDTKRIVIKLGGSLLSPYTEDPKNRIQFDFKYAEKLLLFLDKLPFNYVITIGGGSLNRSYLNVLRDRGLEMPETRQDLHWIGISSGVINASVFRMLAVDKFGTGAVYPEVVKHGMYDELPKHFAELKNYRFIIAGGRQPGRSHDTDALLLAALFDNNKVISLKNIDGVYSADPKKNHKAKKITELSWKEYLEIIGVKIHEPGANYPVDALAAQLAMRSGMQFVICDGLDFVELRTVLITGKAKKGSLIR